MGYQVGKTCYLNASDAFDGWKALFPTQPDSTGAMWFVNAASFSSTASAVTVTGTLRKSSATANYSVTAINFPNCTADLQGWVLDKYPVQDVMFAVALSIAAVIGFISGRMR